MPAPRPKPKQPIEFPDPNRHVDLAALRKEIRETVLGLCPLMRKGEDQNILVEFASVIEPGSFADQGRLPRDSTNARARSKRKEECLFAAVSTMIQLYWDVVLDPDNENNADRVKMIRAELVALKALASKGLDTCKVEGDDRDGYVLIR